MYERRYVNIHMELFFYSMGRLNTTIIVQFWFLSTLKLRNPIQFYTITSLMHIIWNKHIFFFHLVEPTKKKTVQLRLNLLNECS